jgi:hypothetical protein
MVPLSRPDAEKHGEQWARRLAQPSLWATPMIRPALMRFAFLLGAVTALAAVTGCVPDTTYRYSAVVPAARPIAWDGRTARAGTLRVEGTLTDSPIGTNLFPQEHDTAVLVPQWTMEGAATLAVTSNVEIGARAAYASYDWTQPSALGTMPVPGSPSSWGLGPELRVTLPLDKQRHFAIGLAGNLMQYQTPYAEWQLVGACPASATSLTCAPAWDSGIFGSDQYTLVASKSESHWLYSLGAYPSYAFGDHGEYGHAFALLGLTSGLGNDGFTNKPQNGSTIHGTTMVLVGAGYGFSYEMLHVMGMLYRPFYDATSEIQYGFGFQLGVGVNLDLWQPSGNAARD